MIVKHSSMIQKRNINVKYTRICTQLLRKDMRFLICCTWWSSYSRGKPNDLVTKDKWDRSCRMMYWSISSELEFVLEKEEEREESMLSCAITVCVKWDNLMVCPWKSIEKRRIYRIMIYGQKENQYILRIPMNEKGICSKDRFSMLY